MPDQRDPHAIIHHASEAALMWATTAALTPTALLFFKNNAPSILKSLMQSIDSDKATRAQQTALIFVLLAIITNVSNLWTQYCRLRPLKEMDDMAGGDSSNAPLLHSTTKQSLLSQMKTCDKILHHGPALSFGTAAALSTYTLATGNAFRPEVALGLFFVGFLTLSLVTGRQCGRQKGKCDSNFNGVLLAAAVLGLVFVSMMAIPVAEADISPVLPGNGTTTITQNATTDSASASAASDIYTAVTTSAGLASAILFAVKGGKEAEHTVEAAGCRSRSPKPGQRPDDEE